MTPKEKAFFLLSEMNNAQVTMESFKKASYYGQQELKRKCLFLVDEIIASNPHTYIENSGYSGTGRRYSYKVAECNLKYWQQVKTEIENL
jgi:hypothetical protein